MSIREVGPASPRRFKSGLICRKLEVSKGENRFSIE